MSNSNNLRTKVVSILTLSAAGLGLLLAVIGATMEQYQQGLTLAGIASLPLQALMLFIPRPEIVLNECRDIFYRIGAVLCGLSGVFGIIAIWLAAAGTTMSNLWTRYGRRNHVIVAGDTPFAADLSRLLKAEGQSAVHVRSEDGLLPGEQESVEDCLRCGLSAQSLEARAGLERASALVIDGGGDAETLALARPVLTALDRKTQAQKPHIALRIADTVMSDQFYRLTERYRVGQSVRVSVFDENLLAARHALDIDPLFIRAAARGQKRVHALIVGFGDLGEKLLDQVFLTSIAGDLGDPRVTIIDRDADTCRRTFQARRPRVLDQLDISFEALDIGTDPMIGNTAPDALKTLAKLEKADQFTAIFLALPNQGATVRAALLIDAHRELTGQFAAPIHYRCRLAAEQEDILQQSWLEAKADHGFIRMVVPRAKLIDTVLGRPTLDRLASQLHEACRRGANVSVAANVPWQELSETYRRANRRAADHMAAKLWTIGVRHEQGEGTEEKLTAADRAKIKSVLATAREDGTLDQLAELEHRRWCVERFLDGWLLGKARDNRKKIHPLLVPWEKLKKLPEELDKDRDQVTTLLKTAGRVY
ncbi:RyR domain-containing protein [uncultured Hoeflea sp.]|uniref:RyR domain-containing protein n=1 Tax=uncultured Hoeflea sp. TaxID=538666 RepID=UPI00262E91CC|nr:RyR domain-containing protein [uncultured Hoeflea sp.]